MKGSSSALLVFSILILMFSASIQDSPFKGSCVFRVFVVDLFDRPENIITGKFLSRLGCRVVVFLFLIFVFCFVFFF